MAGILIYDYFAFRFGNDFADNGRFRNAFLVHPCQQPVSFFGRNGDKKPSRCLRVKEDILKNGVEVGPSEGVPVARLHFRDLRALRDLALRPDPGLGEAYEDGRLVVEGDLLALLEALFRSGPPGPRPSSARPRRGPTFS